MENLVAILNDEGKFNEIARVAFDSADNDKSGKIDKAELQQVMATISDDLGIDAPSKEEVDEVFVVLDSDKSGKIEYDEFKLFVRKILESLASE